MPRCSPGAAKQVRDLVARLLEAGQWRPGDPDILLVLDAGYDTARLAFLLDDLPVEVLGRAALRSGAEPEGTLTP